MTQVIKQPKVGLGTLDVIHAFPTSGKSGLVISAFKEGKNVPFVIDTDVILFGWVMPNQIHHELSAAGNTPWKTDDPVKRIWWRIAEALAMQIAFTIAHNVDGVIVTNLVGTQPFWKDRLKTITLAPTADDAWRRHQERSSKTGQRLTDEKVIRSWHTSYMKHVSKWDNSVILNEGEYLCDYFGVKYIEGFEKFEADYYKWMFAEIQQVVPNWDGPKWSKRIPSTMPQSRKELEASNLKKEDK